MRGLSFSGYAGDHRRPPNISEFRRFAADDSRTKTDILILGGGHTGLVSAAYLAAAGLSLRVLERRRHRRRRSGDR